MMGGGGGCATLFERVRVYEAQMHMGENVCLGSLENQFFSTFMFTIFEHLLSRQGVNKEEACMGHR